MDRLQHRARVRTQRTPLIAPSCALMAGRRDTTLGGVN